MSHPHQPYGQYPPQPPQPYGQQPYGPPPGYGQQGYGYGPPGQVPQQPFVSPYPIADVGARTVQGIIDALLQMIPIAVGMLLIIAGSVGAYASENPALLSVTIFLYILTIFGAWGFSFWNHVWRPAKTGTDQSIGMARRDLKVVKLDGSPVSMGDHAIRWLLYALVEGGLIALILIAATERKQRLGDMAAKTVVVQLPSQ